MPDFSELSIDNTQKISYERERIITFSKKEENPVLVPISSFRISNNRESIIEQAIDNNKPIKPILKSTSLTHKPKKEEALNPFRINLVEVFRKNNKINQIKRSSSVLNEFEQREIKKNPQTNLIELFKNKMASKNNIQSSHIELYSSDINSIYSSSSLSSPMKQPKKSATFSIVLQPSFNAKEIIEEASKKKQLKKQISNILGNVPKTKYSLAIKAYEKINQYILVKISNRSFK